MKPSTLPILISVVLMSSSFAYADIKNFDEFFSQNNRKAVRLASPKNLHGAQLNFKGAVTKKAETAMLAETQTSAPVKRVDDPSANVDLQTRIQKHAADSSLRAGVKFDDSETFAAGMHAYDQKDYPTAIAKMHEILQKQETSPIRDLALYWLARANYKCGNIQEATVFITKFQKQYPGHPLTDTVEDELLLKVSQIYNNGP